MCVCVRIGKCAGRAGLSSIRAARSLYARTSASSTLAMSVADVAGDTCRAVGRCLMSGCPPRSASTRVCGNGLCVGPNPCRWAPHSTTDITLGVIMSSTELPNTHLPPAMPTYTRLGKWQGYSKAVARRLLLDPACLFYQPSYLTALW
jgi:hypothetical protein